ncbi:hypothetical protein ILUMI_07135, partial [Ignelater luminosus]
ELIETNKTYRAAHVNYPGKKYLLELQDQTPGTVSFYAPTQRHLKRRNEEETDENVKISDDDLKSKNFANDAVFTYKLPETLSIKKMFKMFLEKQKINITCKAFWSVFKSKSNIDFGLPKSDTCAVCDHLMLRNNAAKETETKQELITEKAFHLARADKFYALKRNYKLHAKKMS